MLRTIKTERMEIQVASDLQQLSRAAAEHFAWLAFESAERDDNRLTVALAGGSTPKSLYRLLADENESFRRRIDWRKTDFFWGDERCVPPASDESNFRTASENLLRPLKISPLNVHRLKGELEPSVAAGEYERVLRSFFNLGQGELPRFDLILLGMGADGHTASLFPGTEVLSETERLVAATFVEKFGAHRLTITPRVINNAAHVIFLVTGADKAETLKAVLEGDFEPDKRPSQIVRPPNGNLTWLIDEAAARLLDLKKLK